MAGIPPGATFAGQLRRSASHDRPIEYVQIDGLVVLKIIKHCQEEGAVQGTDVQGVLLGLVQDGRLEVTNCFPFPRHNDDDDMDEAEYQCVMMRHLRNVNVDHLHVGWYQSNPYGSSNNKLETADSQFMYQTTIEESIVLLYDPIRSQKGFLALKAFRLSNLAMKLCKEGEFTVETLRSNKMSFEKFFEEIPLKIKSSHLSTALMCELEEELPVDEGKQFLDLGTQTVLEKSLQQQMKCVEEVSKWANYQRTITSKQQQIAKENLMRTQRNEPPMTDEEVNKIIKPLPPLQRLEALLNYCQTVNFCSQTSSYAAQNMGKLFMSKALQIPKDKN
jgi:translation initiation factor 3 subunit H